MGHVTKTLTTSLNIFCQAVFIAGINFSFMPCVEDKILGMGGGGGGGGDKLLQVY